MYIIEILCDDPACVTAKKKKQNSNDGKPAAGGAAQKDVDITTLKNIPLNNVYEFMLKKRLVQDRPSAIKLVTQQIGGLNRLQN